LVNKYDFHKNYEKHRFLIKKKWQKQRLKKEQKWNSGAVLGRLLYQFIQGEFQSKQDFLNLAPSSGVIYMSTGALESAILNRLPVKIS